MKNLFIAALLAFGIGSVAQAQNVAINTDGTAADNSAILDVKSTTKGLLAPRMTEAERTGITNPATGLIVYQTNNTAGFYYNAGTPSVPSWIRLSDGVTSIANGGTGATTAAGARTNLGLGSLATLNAVGSTEITDGSIVNADISSSAAIAGSKISGNITGNAANVTGTVAIANGGTGQTTANGALNALLPTQASNSGKVLQTDGTNATWQTPAGGSSPVVQLVVSQAAQTPAATTVTVVDWGTASTNVSSQFNTTTNVFTAATAGLYYISATVSGPVGTSQVTYLKHNSTIVANGTTTGVTIGTQTAAYSNRGTNLSTMVTLAAGDTISLEVIQNAAASTDANGHLTIVKF